MSWCSATGWPVVSQRRKPGDEDEYRWSQARLVDSAAFSEGSLTGDSAIFGAIFVRPTSMRIREAKICSCLCLCPAAQARWGLQPLVLPHRCPQSVHKCTNDRFRFPPSPGIEVDA